MISSRFFTLILLIPILLCGARVATAKPGFAVLEFSGEAELSLEQRLHLSDQVRAEATRLIGNELDVMTRETMGELATSHELIEASQEGREVDVGRALRVKWLISGALTGDQDLTHLTLKLHDVNRGVTVDIEFAEGQSLNALKKVIRAVSARLLVHLIKGDENSELAELTLPSERLPDSFELSASDTLGLPIPLLKLYDEALSLDESDQESLEHKIEVWSKLTRYRQYPKLRAESSRRLSYWRRRFKRRMQCNRTWSQLEQILALKRAITEEKKESLLESFLEACGRTEQENPNLNAPYFVNKRLAEARAEAERLEQIAEAKRAKEEAIAKQLAIEEANKNKLERSAKALSERNRREYSFLETHAGWGYQLEAGSLSSYHLRMRLQPHEFWSRRLFIDLGTSFSKVSSLTKAEATWSGEWSTAIGIQVLNHSKWAPSISVGYFRRSGENRALGELALRYRKVPDWLNFHLSLQYLHLIGTSEGELRTRGDLPRTYLLDGTPHELRMTVWASTGALGLSLILLVIYGISRAQF